MPKMTTKAMLILLHNQRKKKKKNDDPKAPKQKASKQNSIKKEQKEQIPEQEMKEEEKDYSTLLEHIHAHDLKIGMWCIDDNSGYPGRVATLNKSKTGKHGHAKMTYKLVMPHSGKSSIPMHPGKDLIQRPVMEMTVLKGLEYSIKKVVMVESVVEVKSMKGMA